MRGDFTGAGAGAVGRDPVVATTLVVELRVGTLGGLLDEAVGEHALDRAVEGPGAHADGAVGELFDAAHDGVAVLFAVTEREQDVEDRRGEGLVAGLTGHDRTSMHRRRLYRATI